MFALVMMVLPAELSAQADKRVNNTKTQKIMNTIDKFTFPQLPYAYDALEPYIDKLTMEIHYSKHHKAYFDNFVNAIKGTALESKPLRRYLLRSANNLQPCATTAEDSTTIYSTGKI